MSSIGSGGASGADASNFPDDLRRAAMNPRSDVRLPQGAMGRNDGEPVEVVEVVTLETAATPGDLGDLTGDSLDEIADGGFRWWYVPAVALPVAAGATAAVLIARRNRKRTPAIVFASLARQSRGWMDTVRGSDTTRKASKAFQRGAASVRVRAMSLPDQAGVWRDAAVGTLAGVASAGAVQKASGRARDTWGSVLDSVTGFWADRGIRTRTAVKEQPRGFAPSLGSRLGDTRDRLAGAIAGLTARDTAASSKDRAKRAKAAMRAKARAAQARNRALKAAQRPQPRALFKPIPSAATTTGAKTGTAAKKTGKTVSSAWKSTRAFTLAMLVSAIVTYVRAWRMHRDEKELRETAGGRLAPADAPQQFQRA